MMVNVYPRRKIWVLIDVNQHSTIDNPLLLIFFRAGLNTMSPVIEVLHLCGCQR